MFVSAIVSLDSPIKKIKKERIIRGFKINNKKLGSPESLSKEYIICYLINVSRFEFDHTKLLNSKN